VEEALRDGKAAVSLSHVLAIIAVVVSFGSAFATLYFQYFEGRRVAVVPGDWMDLSYGQIADSGGYSDLGC
jgi:hypothetical protein